MRINGTPSEVSAAPGSYLAISRTWANGDRVELSLPMSLRTESMADDHTLSAFLYGPIVLAGSLGNAGITRDLEIGPEGPELSKAPALPIPEFSADNQRIDEWIKPGDRPGTFQTTGQKVNVTLAPFYEINHQRYSLYWKIT